MSSLKKIVRTTHLWLGLISGLIVFIVAITGCIYAFKDEIQSFTQSYRYVDKQNLPYLPPSEIVEVANNALPDKDIHAVMYHQEGMATEAIYFNYEEYYYYFVYVNPYTGEVFKVKDEFADFFRIVLDGHFYLWLPHEIGQPLVASFTLVFVLMLISGIVLWWPKNRIGKAKSFKIKWDAKWRRKNYDLHSVLGFYICWLALLFSLTGLIWGFEWYRDGVFELASGGEAYVDYYDPPADITAKVQHTVPAIDQVYEIMKVAYPDAETIEVHPPHDESLSIAANANPDASTFWKIDYRYFDPYTLEELPVSHQWNRLAEATNAELMLRMNYDIHVGAIAGLAGKLLAFFASLTVASLPVTGVLLWYGRRNKKPKRMETSVKRKRVMEHSQ